MEGEGRGVNLGEFITSFISGKNEEKDKKNFHLASLLCMQLQVNLVQFVL